MMAIEFDDIKETIKKCLDTLYRVDEFLFRRNGGRGVCERCLTFRFAHYLQNELPDDFVDCDFDSSFEVEPAPAGNLVRRERRGKGIMNPDGTETDRLVDIIVHRRDFEGANDLICFEIKKWNNEDERGAEKDRRNLIDLTTRYGYFFGFHVVLGETKEQTRWTVYEKGRAIIENEPLFD